MSRTALGWAFGAVLALGIVVFGLVPLLWISRRARLSRAAGPSPVDYTIDIEGLPAGTVVYREGEHEHRFDWELGGPGHAVCWVYVPSEARWPGVLPWAVGRREDVLERVATAVKRRAGASRWEMGDEAIGFFE